LGVGFIAGLTADAVFAKLLGLEVVKTSGIGGGEKRG
jgi:cell shape-determining protein MreD